MGQITTCEPAATSSVQMTRKTLAQTPLTMNGSTCVKRPTMMGEISGGVYKISDHIWYSFAFSFFVFVLVQTHKRGKKNAYLI